MQAKALVLDLINHDPIIFNDLQTYVDLVLEYNQKMNLTGFNEQTIWQEAIYQSIVLVDQVLANQTNISLLDIGAGAGFPSVPYLIYAKNQKIELTIIEASLKRIKFLEIVKQQLNLKINLIHARAEATTDLKEQFDFITARAVTSLKNLIEISCHLGKINSQYFFLKSKKYQEEIAKAQSILKILKINNLEVKAIDLNDQKEHVLISYQKLAPTPQSYPRSWNIISKESGD